jgi:hypothetical protein
MVGDLLEAIMHGGVGADKHSPTGVGEDVGDPASIAGDGLALHQPASDESVDQGRDTRRADREPGREGRRGRGALGEQYEDAVLREGELDGNEGGLDVLGQAGRGPPGQRPCLRFAAVSASSRHTGEYNGG